MSWVKLDDGWWTNAKVHRVEPLDRLLWLVAISWASREGTDGLIPAHMLGFIAGAAGVSKPDDAAQRLTEARLWDLVPEGWMVHDYLDYQPASQRREQLAEEHRRRQAAYEARRRVPKEPVPLTRQGRISDASSDAPLTLLPSRPVPSRISSSSTDLQEGHPHPVDDDDGRAHQALTIEAETLAQQAPGIRNRKGYARSVITNAPNDGRLDDLTALARKHPDRDAQWLADEHLGNSHPADPNCQHCGQPRHPQGPCPTLLQETDR